ncbi:MAG: ABC transporter ATP-binding protein [Oscillatoriales cyanobacterium SM2_2_1]|nr:ABC transporter ATP-binding protein [Oscillatoriales cyanobacterium SM2_2_1]
MTLLHVESLVAGYVPGIDILQGTTMDLEAGDLVAVIGANGAGKSTLARTIFGLVPVRSGTIHFQGQNITGQPPERLVTLGVSYVPQSANVFPSLTIAENLEMGAFRNSSNLVRRQQRIYDLFPILGKRRQQAAGTLSGGERQMLAMGKALMMEPQLLILDEPSAALSPILVQDIFRLIQQIHAQGTTILLVEQNARKALAIAQKGYVMDGGKERFSGSGTELLHHPQVVELYLGKRS